MESTTLLASHEKEEVEHEKQRIQLKILQNLKLTGRCINFEPEQLQKFEEVWTSGETGTILRHLLIYNTMKKRPEIEDIDDLIKFTGREYLQGLRKYRNGLIKKDLFAVIGILVEMKMFDMSKAMFDEHYSEIFDKCIEIIVNESDEGLPPNDEGYYDWFGIEHSMVIINAQRSETRVCELQVMNDFFNWLNIQEIEYEEQLISPNDVTVQPHLMEEKLLMNEYDYVVYAPPNHGKTTFNSQNFIADTDYASEWKNQPRSAITNFPTLIDKAKVSISLISDEPTFVRRVHSRIPHLSIETIRSWYPGTLRQARKSTICLETNNYLTIALKKLSRLKQTKTILPRWIDADLTACVIPILFRDKPLPKESLEDPTFLVDAGATSDDNVPGSEH